jgi:hypothetical protein
VWASWVHTHGAVNFHSVTFWVLGPCVPGGVCGGLHEADTVLGYAGSTETLGFNGSRHLKVVASWLACGVGRCASVSEPLRCVHILWALCRLMSGPPVCRALLLPRQADT